MDFLTEFSQTWAHPQMRHAILVHMPISLSVLCVVAAIWSAVRKGKVASLQWAVIGLTAGLALSAFGAKLSGQRAEETVKGALTHAGDEILHEHESLGERVWMLAAVSCGVAVMGFTRKGKQRVALAWGAALMAMVTAGWTANTGHHGGKLVYEFGAVTPTNAAPEIPEATSPDGSTETDDPVDPRVVFFEAQVLPILRAQCFRCHNPERARRAGGLDQTTIAGLLAGGMSGPAIVPGDPANSLMIEALTWEDEDLQMPPMGRLTDEQIDSIRDWIKQGAVWSTP